MMEQYDIQSQDREPIKFSHAESRALPIDTLSLFKVVTGVQADREDEFCSEHSFILFVLRGTISVTTGNSPAMTVNSAQCVFLPKQIHFKVLTTKGSDYLVMRFSYNTFMSNGCEVWDDCKTKIERCTHPILDLRPMMVLSLECIISSREMLTSPNYQRIKAEEVHEVARQCYSNAERAWFCQSIIRPKDDFRAYIEANVDKVKNCNHLAEMVGMSKTTFNRLFAKTFGESVHNYLMKHKAVKMIRLVCSGEQDYKRLMAELNFTDKSSYIRFCRRWMGGSPSEVIGRILDENR